MAQPSLDRSLGAHDATDGRILSRYLLDTTVLIAHLRGDRAVTDTLLQRLSERHSLGTTCVNIAEIERASAGGTHTSADAARPTGVLRYDTRGSDPRRPLSSRLGAARPNHPYAGRAHRR